MKMGGTGEIIDFTKPNPNPPDGQRQDDVQRLTGRQPSQGVQIVGGGGYTPPNENPGPDAPEINVDPAASTRLLERVVTDEDRLRANVKKPSDPDVRIREGVTQKQWLDEVKRGDDE
jgi:hypothetical protein